MLLSASRLALVAIVALAATTFVSCRPVDKLSRGGSVSYPAAYAVPLDAKTKEACRLDAILMGSEIVSSLNRIQDPTAQSRMVRPFLQGQKDWSRVSIPADLGRVLGSAAMYVLRGDGQVRELVCIGANTLYILPGDLNQLLKDRGMRFTNADVHAWAPLVIWVCLACTRVGTQTSGMHPGNQAFESTFDSIVRGQTPLMTSMTVGKLAADTARPEDRGRSRFPVLAGNVSEIRADVQVDDSPHAVSIYTANGSPRGDGLYPVEFVYCIWGKSYIRMDLPKPTLGGLDGGPPKFGMVEDGRPVFGASAAVRL